MHRRSSRESAASWLVRSAATLALLLGAAAHAAADEKPYAPLSIPGAVIVTAEEVAEMILTRGDLVIIDSRKKPEFSKGHIEGAINLLNTTMQREALEGACPNKAAPIVFYCNGERCLRSSDAVRKAMEWGYSNVFWFRGGWKEWTDKRLPVVSQ